MAPSTSPEPAASPDSGIHRRALLKGLGYGAAGLAAAPVLAACGGDDKEPAGGAAPPSPKDVKGSTITFGSNASDEVPKKATAAVLKAFETKSGATVKINTSDHGTFQEKINNYLQGKPDDVFTWFAGYRMQFFARQGLASPINDVWDAIGGGFSDAMKAASTGEDGKQYFVPLYYYNWAVFHRKSLFDEKGYKPAANLEEFKALCEQMKGDGIVPLGFADKDGWPAMGTFDYLNMRHNGYQFHIDLMAGKKAWDSDEVKQVFNTWRELMPYHQPAALGRTWQEAGQALAKKQTGMMVFGMFVLQQFPDADKDDLDFFPFPEINPDHGTDAVEAPSDGYMLSKSPANEAGAKELLKFLGTAEAGNAYLKIDPSNIAAHNDADTSGYTPLQKKAADQIRNSKQIAQFLDRDTRPDFASTVMIPSLQDFIRNPNDIDGLTKKIEAQKKTIFID
jgi:multiple sugar transport system substrate-binding protein